MNVDDERFVTGQGAGLLRFDRENEPVGPRGHDFVGKVTRRHAFGHELLVRFQ